MYPRGPWQFNINHLITKDNMFCNNGYCLLCQLIMKLILDQPNVNNGYHLNCYNRTTIDYRIRT